MRKLLENVNVKTTFSLTILLKLLRSLVLWGNRWCVQSPGGTPIKKRLGGGAREIMAQGIF